MNYEKVEEVALKFADIESKAQNVTVEYGFDRNTISIREFAVKLGGEISILDDPTTEEWDGGSLYVEEPGKFRIFLSPFTGYLRDNFTIAHELGHYFLHSGEKPGEKKIKAQRYGTGRVEQQANRFAAALLMPADEFRGVASRTSNDRAILAGYFRVSLAAVEARLKSLGIPEPPTIITS